MVEKKQEEMILKEMHDLIYKLKRSRSKSKTYYLGCDISMLYDICIDLNITPPDFEKYSCRSEIDMPSKRISLYDIIENNLNFVVGINKVYKELVKKYPNIIRFYNDNSFRYMDSNTSRILAETFLENYDKDLLIQYKNMVNKNRIIKQEGKDGVNYGMTYPFLSLNDPYIVLYSNYNISDAITLVHEMAHVDEYNIKRYYNLKNKIYTYNIYVEVYSYFMELVFYNFLDKCGYNKNEVRDLRMKYDSILLRYMSHFVDNIYEDDRLLLEQSLNGIYGMSLAYYFYDIYLTDKEKAKYLIKRMIEINYEENIYKILNELDINDEEINKCSYIKKHIYNNFSHLIS